MFAERVKNFYAESKVYFGVKFSMISHLIKSEGTIQTFSSLKIISAFLVNIPFELFPFPIFLSPFFRAWTSSNYKFLTNRLPKGCGFLVCIVLVFGYIIKSPSIHFGAQRSNETASKRYCVCSTKNMRTNPEHVKNWRKKLSPSAIEISVHFHCSCVGQKSFFRVAETFYTMKSFAIDF